MNNEDGSWKRGRFWIHFVCGALLGAGLGFAFWVQNFAGLPLWICIGGFSLLLALLGGFYGDRFWDAFLRNLRWWV